MYSRSECRFSSPIISFDIIKEWSDWKIALLSFTA